MAFEFDIDIDLKCNCKAMRLKNTTGIYEVTTNPGGFGAPNPENNTVDSILGEFTFSDGRIFSDIDLLTAGFVFTDENWHVILNTTIGLLATEHIPDQKGFLKMTIVAAGDTYEKIFMFYPICQVKCCVSNLAKKVKPNSECCDESAIKIFNEAAGWIFLLEDAIHCCDIEAADAIYARLKKICSENGCENC